MHGVGTLVDINGNIKEGIFNRGIFTGKNGELLPNVKVKSDIDDFI
jgi:hypothetical protein